jgi:hypothetical protein
MRKITMTYWERLRASARQLNGVPYHETDRIEIWYDCTEASCNCEVIHGREQAYMFLSTHSSFAEVQHSRQLPATIDHISCMVVQKGTIEEFWKDGSSLLERDILPSAGGTASSAIMP